MGNGQWAAHRLYRPGLTGGNSAQDEWIEIFEKDYET